MPTELLPDKAALTELCRRYQIVRLSLFGSRLKGTHRPDSDVDLLVVFDSEARPGLFDVCGAEIELSGLLGGMKVDLRTAEDLSHFFRDEVVSTAEVIYEATPSEGTPS
jgi:predicted nucleotidyltransferase